MDASSGDQERTLGRRRTSAARVSSPIRSGPPDPVHPWLEEGGREVVRLRLDVLRQAQEGRPAVSGVEHRRHGLGKGLEQLRRVHDPVPIAGHGPEGVVHRDARIPERLHLLEHRVRHAVRERVAGEQEHGRRFACAMPAAVTMFSAPGPIELVATMI